MSEQDRENRTARPGQSRPRIVIVGAGFGGLWAAKALGRKPVDVQMIDRNNYHAFWPLLYQIGAAEIEATEIAYPVRSIVRDFPNVRFRVAEATSIDPERKVIHASGDEMPYDYLILALGSSSHFLNIPGADRYSFPLNTMEDGMQLRNRILSRFELAIREKDAEARRRLLTFVITGGGPTGVEFAGAVMELIQRPLKKDFPELDFDEVSVVLLEAVDRLLTGFEESLGSYAHERLKRMGVDVRLGSMVEEITPDRVKLKGGSDIPTETVIWTAGVRGAPLAERWGLPVTRKGTVEVERTLQVRGHPDIYVVGDLAHLVQRDEPLPMVAPVATQQGKVAAANILRRARDEEQEEFTYDDPGMMATVGRNKAVAQIRGRKFTGFPAWLLWVGVHVANLIGFRNKVLVLINWAMDYFLYERAVRLILGHPDTEDFDRERRGSDSLPRTESTRGPEPESEPAMDGTPREPSKVSRPGGGADHRG